MSSLRKDDVVASEAGSLWYHGQDRASPLYLGAKRAVDLAVSLAVLVLGLPVLILVGVLVRLDSPGPALFKQRRVGEQGRDFVMYKFRSMYRDADQSFHRDAVAARLGGGGKAGEVGRSTPDGQTGEPLPFAGLEDDPRVTRIGRFLRRTNLDELPQVVNVLKGEMSLVGPRPGLPYEVALYKDWQRARLAARPGITGLWQVRGRGSVTFDDMVRLDLDYIASRSLALDLSILFGTLPALLARRRAS